MSDAFGTEESELGARFTKWRAVITIGEYIPSRTCIDVNALALALSAALSQEAGWAPIVEPAILMNGSYRSTVLQLQNFSM